MGIYKLTPFYFFVIIALINEINSDNISYNCFHELSLAAKNF